MGKLNLENVLSEEWKDKVGETLKEPQLFELFSKKDHYDADVLAWIEKHTPKTSDKKSEENPKQQSEEQNKKKQFNLDQAMLEYLGNPTSLEKAPKGKELSPEKNPKGTREKLLMQMHDLMEAVANLNEVLKDSNPNTNANQLKWDENLEALNKVDELTKTLRAYDKLTNFQLMGDPAMKAIHGYVRGLQKARDILSMEADQIANNTMKQDAKKIPEDFSDACATVDTIVLEADTAGIDLSTLDTDLTDAQLELEEINKQISEQNKSLRDAEKAKEKYIQDHDEAVYCYQMGSALCAMAPVADELKKTDALVQKQNKIRADLMERLSKIPQPLRDRQDEIVRTMHDPDHDGAMIRQNIIIAQAVHNDTKLYHDSIGHEKEQADALRKDMKDLAEIMDSLKKVDEGDKFIAEYIHERLEAPRMKLCNAENDYRKYLENQKIPQEEIEKKLKQLKLDADSFRVGAHYTSANFEAAKNAATVELNKAKEFKPEDLDPQNFVIQPNTPDYVIKYLAYQKAIPQVEHLKENAKDIQSRIDTIHEMQQQVKTANDKIAAATASKESSNICEKFIKKYATANGPKQNDQSSIESDERIAKFKERFNDLLNDAQSANWGGTKKFGDSHEFSSLKQAFESVSQPGGLTETNLANLYNASFTYKAEKRFNNHPKYSGMYQFRVNLAQDLQQLSKSALDTLYAVKNDSSYTCRQTAEKLNKMIHHENVIKNGINPPENTIKNKIKQVQKNDKKLKDEIQSVNNEYADILKQQKDRREMRAQEIIDINPVGRQPVPAVPQPNQLQRDPSPVLNH